MSDIAPVIIAGRRAAARSRVTRLIHNPATLELVGTMRRLQRRGRGRRGRGRGAAQHGLVEDPRRREGQVCCARSPAGSGPEGARALHPDDRRETGKPLIESIDCIDWVAACFEYYAEVGRQSYGNSVPPVAPHQLNFTIKEPFGVVAAIVPFNFPLLLMAWKVAPALAAGNTLVCKPPHQNPLSNLLLAQCYDALPPGVVNVVTGGRETGEALVRHPKVDLIAFTGSAAAGRQDRGLAAGAELKKVNLELGSVDPFIVFGDADLDVAVPGVAWARLLNAGQVCTSLQADLPGRVDRRRVHRATRGPCPHPHGRRSDALRRPTSAR